MKTENVTVESSMGDFRTAFEAKRKLVERELEDFRYALGDQWSKEDAESLTKANIKPITDNRIAPNIYLLTGLERQNRTNFKAFPEGEEDGVKSEIASALFINAIKVSDFHFKSSDQFKDGITCGESHLELYLDFTENLLNGKPCWHKVDGNVIFPEPGYREYDYSDARYIYKIVQDVSKGDLMNLYPEKAEIIEQSHSGRLDFKSFLGASGSHVQKRDYPKETSTTDVPNKNDDGFDLVERYYKKWVPTYYIADTETGRIQKADDKEKADEFMANYTNQIAADDQAYNASVQQILSGHLAQIGPAADQYTMDEHYAILNDAGRLPPPPPPRNPERFKIIKRQVPEIWVFAHVPGISEPLADERAWFYPKWKKYPFVPFFARFSTAPLEGDERHLLIQGLVHGVKGVQEKHNKAEMLLLRHLNSTANSGWIAEEDSWVNPDQVKDFGTVPGVNLEYKKGRLRPERIFPTTLSSGHAQLAESSAEAIKSQLGINADLLATQEGSSQSGRAIALRQKQGLLMVQELFDNLSRSRIIAGKMLLSQLGEIYDTETAKKVLGEAWMIKTFPPPTLLNEQTGQPEPMMDANTGKPMAFDQEMADLAIAEVLSGELETYDVTVGEAVASETKRMADAAEVREIAQTLPGIIPPDVLIENSQLPESTKNRIMASIKQAQAIQAQGMGIPSPNIANAGKVPS
jgi:hypothetical protein